MPLLLKDFRVNDFSGRRTVYSKIKRITDSGFDTSNDYFSKNFTKLLGINNESLTKDYFSSSCHDILYVSKLGIHVACGNNWYRDTRSRASTFLYSEDNGVSWTFSDDTFEFQGGFTGSATGLILSNDTIFCSGIGGTLANPQALMSSVDGKNWTNVSTPFNIITKMSTDGSGTIIVAGTNNSSGETVVCISVDNGTTWTDLTHLTSFSNITDIIPIFSNDRFFIGFYTTTSNSAEIYTSVNLTSWTQVTFTDGTTNITPQLSGILNGVYYSSVINRYILYLGFNWDKAGYAPAYYSDDGINFTVSGGINEQVYDVTNVSYDDSANSFYLSVKYPISLPNPDGLTIMYKSPDGEAWQSFLTGDSVVPGFKNILGISQFYIDNSGDIHAIGVYGRVSAGDNTYFSTGLINITINAYINKPDPILLDGETCSKLLYNNSTFLVGMQYGTSRLSIANSIYYTNDSLILQPTEHQDAV